MRSESGGSRGVRRSRAWAGTSTRAAVVAAGVLLSGAACSSSAPSSSGPASPSPSTTATSGSAAAYCDDLDALSQNVDQLRAVNPTTATAAQVQSIITDAKSNLDKAASDASGTAKAKVGAIQTAYSALVGALSGLPSNITGVQAFQRVQPQLTALVAAVDGARAGSGCPSPSATASP
jgi:hypothetical protein